MKIIVSHDIDNLTVFEHKKDFVIQKYLIRCLIEKFHGTIDSFDFKLRLKEIISNKWQNISEIIHYNQQNKIPTTFFIALNNAKGLSYSRTNAFKWISYIKSKNCDVGLHGIEFDNFQKMKNEHQLFKEIYGNNAFGIRMHYLRRNSRTKDWMEKIGYQFDSTEWGFTDCYKYGNLWEFPLQIMDVHEIFGGKKFQTMPTDSIIRQTKKKIEIALNRKLKYLSINFHDRYFSSASRSFQDWYFWLIDYLKSKSFVFSTFKEAIHEMQTR
jgi:peptidoglycan/xylan/chitin deacetylase (PgdA/CDA1 family)